MLVQVKICVDDVKKVCKDVTDIRCREGETIECRDEIKEVNQSQRGERFLFNPTRSPGRSAPQSTGTPVGTRTKQSAPPSSSPTVSRRRSRRYTRTSNIFTSLISKYFLMIPSQYFQPPRYKKNVCRQVPRESCGEEKEKICKKVPERICEGNQSEHSLDGSRPMRVVKSGYIFRAPYKAKAEAIAGSFFI